MPWKRIGAALAVIMSFIYLPFWVTLLLGVFFLYYFEYYVEFVFISFFADVSYAVPVDRFWGFEYVMTIIALVLFLLSLFIKPLLLR